jgi:ribokinase
MPDVLVIGSSNLDLTVRLDRLPVVGETVSGGEFYQSFGGKGANQAIAAHRAGAEVLFVTKLGADANGRVIAQHLVEQGIPAVGLRQDRRAPTGVALIVVDTHGRNMIAVAPGSNRLLTADDIREHALAFEEAKVLLVQLEVPRPAVAQALTLAKAKGMTTIVNPAPAQPLPDTVLKLVDILTPNETEVTALTGQTGREAAARDLLARGVREVVVTLGEQGALWVNAGRMRAIPPFKVQPVDSTAAGDAFNGALAAALAEGQPFDRALRFASAAGALSVTKRGAQDSLPDRREIEAMLDRTVS